MNNKKSIIALLLVAIIGIVGLTIAYFSSEATIENEFQSNQYGTTVEEVFTSPDNWTPGTTTPKTLTVTNTGNVDEAVRVSYTETWTSANAQAEGDLALTQNGNSAAIINWANTSDWTSSTENGTTYKYYNYKLAPHETTSELLSSVTFNSAITNDQNCVTSNNGQTIECTSTGNGYDGATYKLTFHIETVQYDKYEEAWGTEVEIATEKPLPASEYLATNATNAANAEYNTTTKGKMFQFTHTLNEGTENETTVTESRYIGDEPNNYVYFNCDAPQEGVEYNYAASCEVWRILGVFDVDDGTGQVEQRIKLVRGSAFATNMQFNSSYNDDWTDANTSLKNFLNGDYYNRTGDASTYGLKSSAQNMIGNAVYYLGAVSYDSTNKYGDVDKIYGEERGTTFCGSCGSDTTKLTWTGKVGLMYLSDQYMVYGNGVFTTCYDNPAGCYDTNTKGWIFKSNIREGQTGKGNLWLLSPITSRYVIITNNSGGLNSDYATRSLNGVRPVVYLKSSVQIDGGTGASGDPYKLK